MQKLSHGFLGIVCQRAQDEVEIDKERSQENTGPRSPEQVARSLLK